MEYSFKTYNVSNSKYFDVELIENEYYILNNFTDSDWTSLKAQEIIDGVKKAQESGERYEWANEDVHLVALEDGVYFFDLMARRADKNHPEGQDLDLEHEEFLTFMEDFKKFLEENGR